MKNGDNKSHLHLASARRCKTNSLCNCGG